MDSSANAKQQIVDRVKQSTNILVTVNSNPSVDALSAALAFTLILNKLDKHATAVFSGVIPPAINFLEPGKTFENKVDSLRDFIIALDKEKADRLRYKVEDNVVKIFITPYRATITQRDLQFSQGDFNVDLIVALGVEKREELDKAITAHGRILHDATVMTINAANQKSSLGAVDWQDATASSLCEMLLTLTEGLQSGLLEQQISTALLTGIVAATERFSNQRTTPRVMTVAAQLMAAGANQQLIATNLRNLTPVLAPSAPTEASTKLDTATQAKGEMQIQHEVPAVLAEQVASTGQPPAVAFNEFKKSLAPMPLQKPARKVPPVKTQQQPLVEEPAKPEGYVTSKPSWMGRNIQPPSMGGSLSATAEEALESKMRDEADERNHTLLTHNEPVQSGVTSETLEAPAEQPPINENEASNLAQTQIQPAGSEPEVADAAPELPPVIGTPAQPELEASQPTQEQPPTEEPRPIEPSIEQLEQEAKRHNQEQPSQGETLNAARQAVDEALAATPFNPAGQPAASIGAQDFIPLPQPATIVASPVAVQPQNPQPSSPNLPPLPPLPDFSTLPPLPSQEVAQLPPLQQPPVEPLPQPSQPIDPGQFRIPGA